MPTFTVFDDAINFQNLLDRKAMKALRDNDVTNIVIVTCI